MACDHFTATHPRPWGQVGEENNLWVKFHWNWLLPKTYEITCSVLQWREWTVFMYFANSVLRDTPKGHVSFRKQVEEWKVYFDSCQTWESMEKHPSVEASKSESPCIRCDAFRRFFGSLVAVFVALSNWQFPIKRSHKKAVSSSHKSI